MDARKINIFKSSLFAACLLVGQLVWSQSTPVPQLQASADNILATLKQNKAALKNNPKIIYQAVERYLLPLVDVQGMSRSVLGREAWNKATPAERQAFSSAFTQLVIRTYGRPLTEYTDEQIKIYPVRGALDGRFVRVNSVIIRSHGNNIPLNYSLVSIQGTWKIYDLSVEGVSLLQSFHSQFASALQKSNIKEIIRDMNNRAGKS